MAYIKRTVIVADAYKAQAIIEANWQGESQSAFTIPLIEAASNGIGPAPTFWGSTGFANVDWIDWITLPEHQADYFVSAYVAGRVNQFPLALADHKVNGDNPLVQYLGTGEP